MRDGCYLDLDGEKVIQKMCYEEDEDLPKYLWGA